LSEDELTLPADRQGVRKQGTRSWMLVVLLAVLLVGIGGLYLGLRRWKSGVKAKGVRGHLVEQLSYHPVGVKSGIGLYKVGSKFFLIGISPSQISFLTRLQDLEKQYEEDASLEREAFRQAVGQEMGKMLKATRGIV